MKLRHWLSIGGLLALLVAGGCAHRPVQAPVAINPDTPATAQETILMDEIRQALTKSVEYPRSALMRGETGRTVISFDYLDGKVSNSAILQSSGFHDLDYAAISAMQRASIPPAPPAFEGKLLHLHDYLDFSLGN
ncbi:MAG: energy transducer TonB [Candidatus Saccharimonadales bacterium]